MGTAVGRRFSRWLARRGKPTRAAGGATVGEVSPGFVEDLRAALPAGLAAALPAVAPEVLFVAVSQVRVGKDSGDLEREFGLSPHDAETIYAYARR
jgi:hypothetical protein